MGATPKKYCCASVDKTSSGESGPILHSLGAVKVSNAQRRQVIGQLFQSFVLVNNFPLNRRQFNS
jgi:hypothetical protein